MLRSMLPLFAIMGLIACSGDTSTGAPDDPAFVSEAEARDCRLATDSAGDFYSPPESLSVGAPGDVIRCEAVTTPLAALSSGTRIMYRSTDTQGAPIAVTGIVLDPLLPWSGSGDRPLVSVTVGTHGPGDQCAPSRLLSGGGFHYSLLLNVMVEYETAFVLDLLVQGIAVVVTDYQGLGTPGTHLWMNRVAAAHASIDAIRAAQRFPESSIPRDGAVAFMGYSQGGHAAASAAELLPHYAPELHVVGVYSGAAPTDLPEFISFIDGTTFFGLQAYYLSGLASLGDEAANFFDGALNAEGQSLRAAAAEQCVLETIATYAYQSSREFTAGGETFVDLLDSEALRELVARDRLGNAAPEVPVLLVIGRSDEIVPPAGVRRLAADWCALGATVELQEFLPFIPTLGSGVGHIGIYVPAHVVLARNWLRDRFFGMPVAGSCDLWDHGTAVFSMGLRRRRHV